MKTAFLSLSLFTVNLVICLSSHAHEAVAALLAENMREYQVRYRVLNDGANYVWPSVFNCLESGTPAPPNPSGQYYGREVEDPERLAELADALLGMMTPGFLGQFVSNYDELKAGEADEVEFFDLYELGLLGSGDAVAPEGAFATLIAIRRALHRLNFIHRQTYQQNVRMRHGVGFQKFGWNLQEMRNRALNIGDSVDQIWNETYGWDFQSFQPNDFYQSGDIKHDSIAFAPSIIRISWLL